MPSIFTRIIDRELPAEILYESDRVIVIRNINPQAPVHVLAIPKQPVRDIEELLEQPDGKDTLFELFTALRDVAATEGLAERGYRIRINRGEEAGQTVFHLHLHLLGGTKLSE